MQQLLATGIDASDVRITPERGKVACFSCGKNIPLERASFWELLDGGLIVCRLACHPECLSGKTKEEIKREAHQSAYDIFLGDRHAFGGIGANL